ncbi:hypothetical protein [Actinokineospora diospyrosa]|uniref:SAF domain-containing protein n=1 Tax=Actinokineospora diospyrosa TaxID=103728 RepID=A0ABT1I5R9_9PSEU|nr:hypothetical protein [Actinokineospora diospyrosa]MCP2267956.1 hypothetical protein [Actinokineospora diospyrosa]
MATVTSRSAADERSGPRGWSSTGRAGRAAPGSRVNGVVRRRRAPYLLLGVLLVVVCAGAGVYVATQAGNRVTVLALARAVTVGQVLVGQDLRQVSMSVDSGLDVVTASESATVVGTTMAYPAPAGTLLSRGLLGAAEVPAAGSAITAVGLKDGQFPPSLTPGTHVLVLISPPASTGTSTASVAAPRTVRAVVTDVQARQSEQTTVVSLELPEAGARELAGASAAQVSVVAVGGGR